MKKKKLGLVPKLIIAIILGILVGQMRFLPEGVLRLPVTFSSIFSTFLSFIIPLMILGFVVVGISDLTEGAGKLLGMTTVLAYGSTLTAGILSYLMASAFFPSFIGESLVEKISGSGEGLSTLFSIPLSPLLDVTGAIVFSFVMGVGISALKSKGSGKYLYGFFKEFSEIISKVLSTIIIPFLPVYIFGNFLNLSYSGSVFSILSIFWKVFLLIIALHLLYVGFMFFVAGGVSGKNPWMLLKNQIPGYVTAVGTQSSAATIPVNVECARKNGVSKEIREFVVPLCATIHLAGSIITITSCVTAVLLIYDLPHGISLMATFIATLGVAMVAAPGAPGGAIMSALPFLTLVGIDPTGTMGQLLITLYLTQDSFGTAANVSGDNALAILVETFHKKSLLKEGKTISEVEAV
ncbi:dicarboxylate/amino acid:cation symporter [Proteiniclasticum ruminis]|uniref:Na+/H+-dicarboxylate symporter n=1 Tax=Proteiniclasticum ruminis TaxID=398199 RepID=A0A1I5B5D5_9CLOT|nr:dicarboxylate/amino acid:cation symporter [Proteiniclasticum ruminis]SFN69904.1 Na+/H+-dicarboxylate symporter [Proteiniclasticum ruminis]